MSATNRGEARDPLDFARTPGWAVRALLPHLGRPLNISDLGCGDGAIGRELRAAWGDGVSIVGFEADEGRSDSAYATTAYDETHHVDLLDSSAFDPADWDGAELVIANPPFSRAVEFLDIATKMVRRGGLIAFLLRASWIVPPTRASIPKPDLLFLRRRPSFKKSAKGSSTDSADYAWHLWRPGDPFAGGRWAALECEPGRKAKS